MSNSMIRSFVLACLLILASCETPLRSEGTAPVTSDEWTGLVIQLQNRQHKLDEDDRKFLFRMLNLLTAKDDYLPDQPQRKWLLDIDRRLNTKQ